MDFKIIVFVTFVMFYLVLCEDVKKDLFDIKELKARPVLAIDMHFVDLVIAGKNVPVPIRVTVIDENFTVVYDTLIKSPMFNGGFEATTSEVVLKDLRRLTHGKTLVGNRTDTCAAALGIVYDGYLKRNVRCLCENSFGVDKHDCLQTLQRHFTQERDTLGNAAMSMKLYKIYRREWELYLSQQKTVLAFQCKIVPIINPVGGLNVLTVVRVSVVDYFGGVLFDKKIAPGIKLNKTRPFFSKLYGSNVTDLANLTVERNSLQSMLEGKIVVGHGVRRKLLFLGIVHPFPLCRDVKSYPPFQKLLKNRSYPLLNRTISLVLNVTINAEGFDTLEEASLIMKLYRKHREGIDNDVLLSL